MISAIWHGLGHFLFQILRFIKVRLVIHEVRLLTFRCLNSGISKPRCWSFNRVISYNWVRRGTASDIIVLYRWDNLAFELTISSIHFVKFHNSLKLRIWNNNSVTQIPKLTFKCDSRSYTTQVAAQLQCQLYQFGMLILLHFQLPDFAKVLSKYCISI